MGLLRWVFAKPLQRRSVKNISHQVSGVSTVSRNNCSLTITIFDQTPVMHDHTPAVTRQEVSTTPIDGVTEYVGVVFRHTISK